MRSKKTSLYQMVEKVKVEKMLDKTRHETETRENPALYMLFGMASDDNSQDHDKSSRNSVPHLRALKQSMEHSPFPVTGHDSNSRMLGILAHLEQRRGEEGNSQPARETKMLDPESIRRRFCSRRRKAPPDMPFHGGMGD